MGINNYYIRLERKDKTEFIKEVMELTEVSYPTFMYKIKDDSLWTKLEREAIENLIREREGNERSGVL